MYDPLRLEVLCGNGSLFSEWIARYHYLGCRVPFGANLRYLVRSERCPERVLAVRP